MNVNCVSMYQMVLLSGEEQSTQLTMDLYRLGLFARHWPMFVCDVIDCTQVNGARMCRASLMHRTS